MSSDNITQTKEIKEIKEKITYNFHKKRDDDIMNIISKDDGGVTIEITDDDDKKLNINVSQKNKNKFVSSAKCFKYGIFGFASSTMLTIANLFVPKLNPIPNNIQTASNIFLTHLPNPTYYNIQSASRVGYFVSICLILYGLKNMISVSKSVLSEMPEKIGGVTYLRDDE